MPHSKRTYSQKSFPGIYYDPEFLSVDETKSILDYINSLHPIWEQRYSKNNPPPSGQEQRKLLRPVYWLGNWQFACLDYYHPPKGIHNRCVVAEEFPPILQRLMAKCEDITRTRFPERDIPRGWHMNTCLVNYYGDQLTSDGKKTDAARVGEHKDFEPGPVISLSLGERALFQFVTSSYQRAASQVVLQQWLDHRSLMIFGGEKFKSRCFHRVQRVDRKLKSTFKFENVTDFETRRLNLTFRYVPLDHFVRYRDLPPGAREDVRPYVEKLAQYSEFFKGEL